MKLILENWRKYLEEEELGATAPRKGRKLKRGVSEPMPVDELLPTFFEALMMDPETFDLVPKEAKGKSFEEIKSRADFADFVKDMKDEIGSLLASFSNLPIIKDYLKDGYDRKNFLRFVLELPEKEKSHVLTSIAAMSAKFSSGTIPLLSTAANEIMVYSCLFDAGINPKDVPDKDIPKEAAEEDKTLGARLKAMKGAFTKCREETEVRIEEDLQKS